VILQFPRRTFLVGRWTPRHTSLLSWAEERASELRGYLTVHNCETIITTGSYIVNKYAI
jgi:hypothetical protein